MMSSGKQNVECGCPHPFFNDYTQLIQRRLLRRDVMSNWQGKEIYMSPGAPERVKITVDAETLSSKKIRAICSWTQ
jgi:hypothetical protein